MKHILFIGAAISLLSMALHGAPKQKTVPHNKPEVIQRGDDGTYFLAGTKAELYGEEGQGKIAIYDGEMCIGWFNSQHDYVVWNVEAKETGSYDVWLHWSISDEWANNIFALENGPSRMIGWVPKTGGFDKFLQRKFGQIHLEKGKNRLLLRPLGPVNGEIADIKSITLRPTDHSVPGIPEGGMSPEQTARTLRVPAGFEATVFAAEPLISNPTSIVMDHRDRVWITEASVYREPALRVDRIKVLEDTDKDGRADRVTIFADNLLAPMSLLVAGSKVYVAESPHLLVFEDKDGDLKADGPPTRLLTGFGGYNDDQALHGFSHGPDHRLWMTQGDLESDVTGPDGARFKHDVGALLNCEFDGTKLHSVVWDLKNPIEVAVNSLGEAWFSGNDDDGTRMTRVDYAMQGGFYGWRYWQVYNDRRQIYGSGPEAHWHVNQFGVVPPVLLPGFGSPCGKFFVEDAAFGEEYRNVLFHVDPGPRVVRAYHVDKSRATPSIRTETFISNDVDSYFRPVDGALANDGTLFLCDWYDQGVGGHAYNDANRGRIYMIRPKTLAKRTFDLAAPYRALASPNTEMQYQARAKILQKGSNAIPELATHIATAEEPVASRYLWLLGRLGQEGVVKLKAELKSADSERRALVLRILHSFGQFDSDLYALISDRSAVVRRELLLTLAGQQSQRALDAITELAKQWDGSDRFYLEAVGIAARGPLDPKKQRFTAFRQPYDTMRIEHPQRLEKLFERLVVEPAEPLSPRTVALTLLLRGKRGEEYLLTRLQKDKLPAEAKAAILGSLGPASDTSFAADVLKLVEESKDDGLRKIALNALRMNLRGAWDSLKNTESVQNAVRAALRNPSTTAEALEIVSEARLAWAAEEVQRLLADDDLSIRALQTLGSLRAREAAPALVDFVHASDSEGARTTAITTLVKIFEPDSLSALLSSETLPHSTKRLVLQELLRDTAGALWVFSLVEEGRLGEDLKAYAVKLGAAHLDANIRGLYTQLLPESDRPKTLAQSVTSQEILKMTGDPERGRNVFFNSAAACAQCHIVQGVGNQVGPDLSMIGKKFGKDGLLQSVLNPSAAISPDYATAMVETTDGELLTGFLKQGGGDQYTLRTIANEIHTLAKNQIEKITYQKTSLMPEQLAETMGAQDLSDLLAFLASLDKESYVPPSWWVLGVFPNEGERGFHHDFGPEKNAADIDLSAEFPGIDGRVLRWEQVGAQPFQDSTGFHLQNFVQQRNYRSADLVAYLALGIESPEDQAVHFLLGSEDAVKVWLGGKLVHEHFVRRNPARLGQDVFAAQLKKGRNTLLVKLEQVAGGGGLLAMLQTSHPIAFTKP